MVTSEPSAPEAAPDAAAPPLPSEPPGRQPFLVGLLVGVLVGAALGGLAGWGYARPDRPKGTSSMPTAPSAAVTPGFTPEAARSARPGVPGKRPFPNLSYAQQGEDLLVRSIFDTMRIPSPSYVDIGAYHPIVNNNTYLFYEQGSHGVLIEPNPDFTEMLKALRPNDRVLPIGIGLGEETQADYYVFQGPGQDNTFSKAQADALVKQHGTGALRQVVKVPLRTINRVLDEEFPKGGPDFFSIDIEGLDLAVLQSLDFDKHRPKVICVEMEAPGAEGSSAGIVGHLKSKGYEQRGGNLVNGIFVDAQALK